MSKFLFAGLLCLGILNAVIAADTLPQLPGTPLKPVWKANAVAAVQDGVYRLAAIPTKAGVNYAGFRVSMTGSIKEQAIAFAVKTAEPGAPTALYVRIYDKKNKCIGSWWSWRANLSPQATEFTLIPGENAGRLPWQEADVKSQDTEVARIDFIFGQRNTVGKLFQVEVTNLRFIRAAEIKKADVPEKAKKIDITALSDKGFEDLGIPALSAELRGSIAYMEKGRHYLLTRPQDHGKTGYLLLTDLDSGKTEQYFNPPEIHQRDNFGSILTSRGLFLYDHGGKIIAFDTKTRKTAYLGQPDKSTSHYMVCTEAPDGTVYFGGTYTAVLVSWNPDTGKFRNYGRMDPKEKYVSTLATDKNGYVYCGISYARANLVALDPKTGKITQIIPENMRGVGKGEVRSGADGYAYVKYGKFSAKMLNGKIVEENTGLPAAKDLRPIKAAAYGGKLWRFPDGARVLNLSLDDKTITYEDPRGKQKVIDMPYRSNGLHFTSMGGGNGRIFGSTSHPMHFVEYNVRENKLTDHGAHPAVGGGNFCNITAGQDGKVYMCQYPAGKLWQFDPEKPFLAQLRGIILPPGALDPADLSKIGKVKNGKLSLLSGNKILLCLGWKDGAEFTFPLKVEKAGTYYLNVQAYEHSIYGSATFAFQGKKKKMNLQNVHDRSTGFHLGPFKLAPGTYPVSIVSRSNGKSSKPMFGLNGLLLSQGKPLSMQKTGKNDANPKTLGQWKLDVTRPRAVQMHPDGKHVVISGYPDYGYCGGGFGIHNLATGKNTLIKDWLEGHSCITFRFADNGDIVGGTDIAAPGGGHQVAKAPAIFRLNWKTGKVTAFTEFPGYSLVADVELWKNKLYAVLPNGDLAVADPVTMSIEKKIPNGSLGYGRRNTLLKTSDDRLFFLQTNAISEIHPVTGEKIPLARMKYPLSSAGAVDSGHIYYSSGTHVIRWQIPDVRK